MKTFFKILLIIIFFNLFIPAQKIPSIKELGFPVIRNYHPKEYLADVQNWAVIQDERGVMYIGNGEGVLEYDGVNWRLIKIPNDVVRCLAIDEDGKIFLGGINEIGYLSPDSIGTLKYISLNKYIAKDDANYGDVWRIIVHEDGLYFQTFSALFLLESDKNKNVGFLDRILKYPSLKRWESRTRFNPIHSMGKRIFVHERNTGLQELINGKLVMLPGGEKFAQDLICIMLPYPPPALHLNEPPDKILIGSLRRGMFLFDGNKFEKFSNEADNYLIENRLYFKGALLSDGTYALGTQIGGIVVIDQHGKFKRIFDKSTGLNNNTIWDLFPDREGNLWAALDNGISKIFYPAQSFLLTEKSGFEGSIQAINKFDGKLYIATSSGIYFLQSSSANHTERVFYPVSGISVQSWDFLPYNNSLLVATNDGVMEVKNNSASIIDINLRYAYCLYRSTADPSIIYVGLHNGMAILKNNNGSFSYIGVIPDFQDGVNDIQEDEESNLWLNDISGKILRLKIPENNTGLKSYTREKVSNESIFLGKAKLFRFQNQVYFYDARNVFVFEKSSGQFITSNLIKSVIKDSTESVVHLYNENDKSIWCVTNAEGKTRVLEIMVGEKTQSIKVHSFLETIGEDFISDISLLKFYIDGSNEKKLWTSAGNILVICNISSDNSYTLFEELKPLIRKVSTNNGNILFNGYENELYEQNKYITEVYYSQNSIVFEFASPSFLIETGNDYQYILEGFDDSRSSWNRETKKEYTNLSSGDYTFKVRTRDALGKLSRDAVFSFTVLPPWYETWWANLLWFVIILLFINYVIKFRVQYLKNKNIVLEKLVNERTAKINEQKETLERQAQKLLELDQIKSDFFANISHEFRTPLTLIKGQLENVLGMITDERVRKKISSAFNNSNRLNRLINQVLDLSKLESGKMKLEFEVTDIVSLLRNRVASFDSLAEQNKIVIDFDTKLRSLLLSIDKEKIEEVIDNLLSNAFKFTPANGKIRITIELEKFEFTENAVITICDTGIGIPEDKIAYIFDRFYQTDNSSTKQFDGSGLGLAIVKELIELHGGSITASSKVNSGTSFSIYLPVEASETDVIEAEEIISSERIKVEEDKSLILVVEDNSEVRSYIKENLEQNYRIEEALNGEEGIDKAIDKIPDLIITDVMMPKVDGFELCAKLKNDQRTSHIPIVILTAKADEKNKLGGLQIGADEFLAKPFSPRELEIRVGNLIHIRQLLREKYKEISVIRSEDIKANPIDKEFIDKVFIMVKDHLEDNQFSVQKLADEIGMSVSQLNRKLNALINQSAGKLIRSTKLDYAAKLLEKNAGNITEIGYRIGFSDLSSFTNSFKEKYGVSPTEYLKKKK